MDKRDSIQRAVCDRESPPSTAGVLPRTSSPSSRRPARLPAAASKCGPLLCTILVAATICVYYFQRGSRSDYVWGRNSSLRVSRRFPALTSFGTMGEGYNVTTEMILPETSVGSGEGNVGGLAESGYFAIPEPWDSSLCMLHWHRPELQTEVDPNGYVIMVNGMEKLGGNKFLLSDGVFIAKSLDRTLVEYPVKDSRISTADAPLGLGAYWDLFAMCTYHRILDLKTFRTMVSEGLIAPESFVTLRTGTVTQNTNRFKISNDVQRYFEHFLQHKVIVLDRTWKSGLEREMMPFLRPNPFYMGIVRMLLVGSEDWADGNFLSVQWRTETSTGNLTECYEQIRQVIEEQRISLGLCKDQVFISTDMHGRTSGTFSESNKEKRGGEAIRMIQRDYPKALENELHRFFDRIEDSGVKAIISGLVVASSRAVIASSLNEPWTKNIPEAGVCQKPYSGYIKLITEWRHELFKKDPSTVVRLYPFGNDV